MHYIVGDDKVVANYKDKIHFCYGVKLKDLKSSKILTKDFKNDIVFVDAGDPSINIDRTIKHIKKCKSETIIINGQADGCVGLTYPPKQEEIMGLKLGKNHESSIKQVVGDSQHTRNLAMSLDIIGKTESTVLILGESGVGKEVAANTVHRSSVRNKMPFIAINCGAIPDNLLESELFGYKKGSFTGAYADKLGKIEQASGGTLFLDEIGEMPLVMQTKLLRVLQEKKVQRIGDHNEIDVDIRIISATNANLENKVKSGDFREDLYYRLNVIPINIKSLRDRKEDIIPLINHFASEKMIGGINLDDDAILELNKYAWPGNVREVVNFVERTAAFFQHSNISKTDVRKILSGGSSGLIGDIHQSIGVSIPIKKVQVPLKEAVLIYERKMIVDALESCDGNIKDAGESIGVKRTTLLEKMKRMNIS